MTTCTLCGESFDMGGPLHVCAKAERYAESVRWNDTHNPNRPRPSRYDPPDPKCHHKRKGIVKAGDWVGRHASYAVCDRPACIEDAKEWAWAVTHLTPEFIPDDGGKDS